MLDPLMPVQARHYARHRLREVSARLARHLRLGQLAPALRLVERSGLLVDAAVGRAGIGTIVRPKAVHRQMRRREVTGIEGAAFRPLFVGLAECRLPAQREDVVRDGGRFIAGEEECAGCKGEWQTLRVDAHRRPHVNGSMGFISAFSGYQACPLMMARSSSTRT